VSSNDVNLAVVGQLWWFCTWEGAPEPGTPMSQSGPGFVKLVPGRQVSEPETGTLLKIVFGDINSPFDSLYNLWWPPAA